MSEPIRAQVDLVREAVWPGFGRGPAVDLATDGQFAYVAIQEGGLIIYDISDVQNTRKVGSWSPADSFVVLTNPQNVTQIGGDTTDGAASGIVVEGSRGFLADDAGGLQVFDIADPRNPTVAVHLPQVTSDLVLRPDLLATFDRTEIRVFTRPFLIDAEPWARAQIRFTRVVDIADDRVYAVTSDGLRVFGVASEGLMPLIGTFDAFKFATDLQVVRDRAYLLTRDELAVLDVGDPAHMTTLRTLTMGGQALQVVGDQLFIGTEFGFSRFNLTDPDLNEHRIGRNVSGQVTAFHVSGDLACLYRSNRFRLELWDIRDGGSWIGVFSDTGGEFVDLEIVGNLVYAAHESDGFQVFSFPARFSQPRLKARRLDRSGGLELRLTGPIDETYQISVTRDFTLWTPFTELRNTSGSVLFTDPDAPSEPARFYRANTVGSGQPE